MNSDTASLNQKMRVDIEVEQSFNGYFAICTEVLMDVNVAMLVQIQNNTGVWVTIWEGDYEPFNTIEFARS